MSHSSYYATMKNYLRQMYYTLFDRFFLYPLMSMLPRKLNVQFMNLGYLPKKWSTPQQVEDDLKIDGDDEIIFQKIKEVMELNDSRLAHCFLYEKTLSFCPKYPNFNNKQLLEVGCGLGGGIHWLKRSHSELQKIVGVDKVTSSERDESIILGSAESLPFPAHSFDIVLNVESSHLYENIDKFFEEVYRVLKPGGYLCWADLRKKGEIDPVLEKSDENGFNLVRFKIVTSEVINGIHHTSSRYDKLIETAPWYIRLFSSSLRETYCAPGTKMYDQYKNGEKLYAIGCWHKPNLTGEQK